MVEAVTDIRALHWQPELGADGEVVTAVADVAQAIRIVLVTPKGSDPHRPEFGSDNHRYIDMPVTEARPHVVRASREAIERWEPRAAVIRVTVEPGHARLRVRVAWRLADGLDAEQTTEVEL